MFELQEDLHLTSSQLAQIRRKISNNQTITSTSPAGRLLKQLADDPNIFYVAHIAHYNNANQISIRSHSNLDFVRLCSVSTTKTHSLSRAGRPRKLSLAEKFAKSILDALTIPGTSNLLLCCAWTSKRQQHWFNKYPSVLSLDVTCGTNAEKRPLARGTILTANGKTVPVFDSYLPAEATWAWDWTIGHALPLLFLKSFLRNVKIIPTDHDSKCVSMITKQIDHGFFKCAKHRLCGWHRIDRNFKLPGKCYLGGKFIF